MIDISEFKKATPPKSKLKRFKNEIFTLLEDGYSLNQIQEFLMKNKVDITVQAINKFILKNVKVDENQQETETRVDTKKHKNESDRAANLIEKLNG